MNVRGMIVAAALISTAMGCASRQGGAASSPAAMTSGAREEEYTFDGTRLKVQIDASGMPTGAKAFKNDKEIPTFMVQAREVTVCVPKPAGAAGSAGQQCEPFLYLPEKTFFKIGTGTICSMWYMGRLIYYEC